MAEADVAQLGKLDELRDCLANFRVHSPQPGVEEQGLVVVHQEMVELQIGPGSKDRDAIDIRRDLRGNRHVASSIGFLDDVSVLGRVLQGYR